MNQNIDRLTGIQPQTAIGIVGAGSEAGNGEGDVRAWQAARIDLKIGPVERFRRGAAGEQRKKCDEHGDMSHDSLLMTKGALQFTDIQRVKQHAKELKIDERDKDPAV